MRKNNKDYMTLALDLAAKATDKTYPNPMVGAVIVKGGKIIGKGYHKRAGEDHAEVAAIKQVKGSCAGATMYVTLEPCDHFGKTPPCTKTIIDSGIKNIKIAMKDPNPCNSGRGIKKLRRAGIVVETGICEGQAEVLNRKYIKFITKKLPYITLKLAQSLDGKIAARDGSSKWITSDSARKYVRKLRSRYDGIMIGSNTLLTDDPFLLDEKRKGYNVTRIVMDSSLKTPIDSNIIRTSSKSPVVIGTTELAQRSKVEKFRQIKGVKVIVTKSKLGKVPARTFMLKLARMGIVNLLVEGGGELSGSLLDGLLVDEVMFFIAPKVIGGGYSSVKGKGAKNISAAIDIHEMKIKRFGEDIFVHGYIK